METRALLIYSKWCNERRKKIEYIKKWNIRLTIYNSRKWDRIQNLSRKRVPIPQKCVKTIYYKYHKELYDTNIIQSIKIIHGFYFFIVHKFQFSIEHIWLRKAQLGILSVRFYLRNLRSGQWPNIIKNYKSALH